MNDGGPDVEILDGEGRLENCMRFSDAFWHRLYAGLAMQATINAQLTNDDIRAANVKLAREEKCSVAGLCAAVSYEYADALLAELERKTDGGTNDSETHTDAAN